MRSGARTNFIRLNTPRIPAGNPSGLHAADTRRSFVRNTSRLALSPVWHFQAVVSKKRRMDLKLRLVILALGLGMIAATQPASILANDALDGGNKIKHVLLISVDGLHALDVSNYVAAHPGSAFAELSRH